MNMLTILDIVLLLDACLIFAQDVNLNSFTHSVEATKIKAKPGRHVCTTEKLVSSPIPVIQTYRKPVYTPKPRECPNVLSCPQFDVSYTLANRTVYLLQKSSTFEMNCCPGWTKEQKREKGCMQPICKSGCGDFGICVKPEKCECRPGYSGPMCDTDLDECMTNAHGCQHQCKNTAGSYMCACQKGFNLAPDGRTCILCFTCQKEYQDLLATISALSVNTPALSVNYSAEFRALNTTIHELRQEVLQVTEENKKLTDHVSMLEEKYETAAVEIEVLQNITRTTTPAPTTSTTTPKTTTTTPQTTTTTSPTTSTTTPTTTTPTTTTPTTTTTTPATTTTRTTTPTTTVEQQGLQFDSYDLITSLSNQIGLMEEKLELCQCTYRNRGYG